MVVDVSTDTAFERSQPHTPSPLWPASREAVFRGGLSVGAGPMVWEAAGLGSRRWWTRPLAGSAALTRRYRL